MICVINSDYYGTALALPIQPANERTFPWLSRVARNFEKYIVHQIRFCYEPACGTDVDGQIAMCIDHDANDPTPKFYEVTQTSPNVMGPVWGRSSLKTLPQSQLPYKYLFTRLIDELPNEDNFDKKTYDVGNLFLYNGQNSTVGYLFVEYDLSLYTPQPCMQEEIWGNGTTCSSDNSIFTDTTVQLDTTRVGLDTEGGNTVLRFLGRGAYHMTGFIDNSGGGGGPLTLTAVDTDCVCYKEPSMTTAGVVYTSDANNTTWTTYVDVEHALAFMRISVGVGEAATIALSRWIATRINPKS
jgi:hypothetical protein